MLTVLHCHRRLQPATCASESCARLWGAAFGNQWRGTRWGNVVYLIRYGIRRRHPRAEV